MASASAQDLQPPELCSIQGKQSNGSTNVSVTEFPVHFGATKPVAVQASDQSFDLDQSADVAQLLAEVKAATEAPIASASASVTSRSVSPAGPHEPDDVFRSAKFLQQSQQPLAHDEVELTCVRCNCRKCVTCRCVSPCIF